VCEAGKHAQRGTCLLLHGGHSAWLIFLSLYPCYLSTFSRLAWGGHLYVLVFFLCTHTDLSSILLALQLVVLKP
jgi:hypothetical protein